MTTCMYGSFGREVCKGVSVYNITDNVKTIADFCFLLTGTNVAWRKILDEFIYRGHGYFSEFLLGVVGSEIPPPIILFLVAI